MGLVTELHLRPRRRCHKFEAKVVIRKGRRKTWWNGKTLWDKHMSNGSMLGDIKRDDRT
jgi:hypothetical protein